MNFDTEKTINYWLEGAEYDMSVAEAMFETGKYPYVLFMGHLALEKLLKALVVKQTKNHAPFTHSLPLLAEKLGFQTDQEIYTNLKRFMEFHLEERYPEERKGFYKNCTKEFTENNLHRIKETFLWLKKKL